MSLSHAILTSLLEKPCTGAELARRFDKSLGHFWQATHQQIYRELARMEKAGLVAARELPSGRGQQRYFEVLRAGRTELERWCGSPGELRAIRDGLLVRLRAAAVLGNVDMTAELQRHRMLHLAALARYEEIAKLDFPDGMDHTRQELLQRSVLMAGIAYEQSWLDWSAHALEDLSTATRLQD